MLICISKEEFINFGIPDSKDVYLIEDHESDTKYLAFITNNLDHETTNPKLYISNVSVIVNQVTDIDLPEKSPEDTPVYPGDNPTGNNEIIYTDKGFIEVPVLSQNPSPAADTLYFSAYNSNTAMLPRAMYVEFTDGTYYKNALPYDSKMKTELYIVKNGDDKQYGKKVIFPGKSIKSVAFEFSSFANTEAILPVISDASCSIVSNGAVDYVVYAKESETAYICAQIFNNNIESMNDVTSGQTFINNRKLTY